MKPKYRWDYGCQWWTLDKARWYDPAYREFPTHVYAK